MKKTKTIPTVAYWQITSSTCAIPPQNLTPVVEQQQTTTKKERGGPQVVSRFGPYLKNRRKQKKWTLRKLAELAGTAHSNIYQFENLKKDPRLSELDVFARVFGEPLLVFMRGVIPPSQEALDEETEEVQK